MPSNISSSRTASPMETATRKENAILLVRSRAIWCVLLGNGNSAVRKLTASLWAWRLRDALTPRGRFRERLSTYVGHEIRLIPTAGVSTTWNCSKAKKRHPRSHRHLKVLLIWTRRLIRGRNSARQRTNTRSHGRGENSLVLFWWVKTRRRQIARWNLIIDRDVLLHKFKRIYFYRHVREVDGYIKWIQSGGTVGAYRARWAK